MNQFLDLDRQARLHRVVRTHANQYGIGAVPKPSGPFELVVGPDQHVLEQDGVTSAVATLALLDIDHVGLGEQRVDDDLSLLDAALDVVLLEVGGALFGDGLAAGLVAALDDVDLEPALGAVEDAPVSFPGGVGVRVVRHHRAVLVLDDHGDVVLDGDALAEAVLVADVAVLVLGLEVQLLQLRVLVDVDRERVVLGVRVVQVPLAQVLDAPLRRVLLAVEPQVAQAVDQLGLGVEPEVDQVKVVDRLVHLDAAAVRLVAVPPVHEVRAVRCVQDPVHVHGRHLADDAGVHQLAHLGVVRRVAVVEEHADLFARRLGRVDHLLQLVLVDGHGLLRDGVAPQLHRPDAVLVVELVDGRHDHGVGFLLRHHPVELPVLVGRDPLPSYLFYAIVGRVHARLVRVAQPDQFGDITEILDDSLVVER